MLSLTKMSMGFFNIGFKIDFNEVLSFVSDFIGFSKFVKGGKSMHTYFKM